MKTTLSDVKSLVAKNGIFLALLLLIAFFTFMNPRFLTPGNAVNVVLQISELGIVALPLALLLIAGVVDLSIGSIASISAVVAGLVMASTQSVLLGLVAGVASGVAAGTINGFLVAVLGLNPIVVTLGFLSVWGGGAMLLTGGRTITMSELPPGFGQLGALTIGPVPLRLVLFVVAIAITWYMLSRNRVGRAIYAIGGSERAAYLMGLRVVRVRFSLYVVTGACAAIAGIMLAAKVQSVSPATGLNMEMSALTVVLLGGVAFAGGSGRVSGVVAGLLFFGVLRNGLVFLQASPFLQTVIVGLTLVIAVALDKSIQQIVAKSWEARGRAALARSQSAASEEQLDTISSRRPAA
ncbi:ABC transporter permease [Microbacterium xylanilyticum]